MKIKFLPFLCFLLIGLVQCTFGANFGVLIGNTSNTNPTKNYSYPGITHPIYNKGGLIVHSAEVSGPIGEGAETTASGTSCNRSVLGLVAWGDSSIEAAKAVGKINKVAAVDYEHFAVLAGVYHSFCTVVVGSASASATDTTPAALPKKK